jgi:hypothetical protein
MVGVCLTLGTCALAWLLVSGGFTSGDDKKPDDKGKALPPLWRRLALTDRVVPPLISLVVRPALWHHGLD